MPWTFYNANGQRLSSAATNISVLDIDGATDIGAAIVDADLFIIDDGAGGTNRKTAASRIVTYVQAAGVAAHGASSHTDITRTIFIQPGPAGLGPFLNNRYTVMTMEDNVTDTIATTFYVPADFVSFGSVKAVLTTNAASGNMYWDIDANWAAHGESRETGSETGTRGTTTFSGAKLFHVIEPSDAMALSGLAAGDYVGLTLTRDAGHANDTVNDAVSFHGLLFTYTANQ